MRILALVLLVSSAAFSQNLTEFGAVTAASTVGGASGKSVSDGLNSIFGKIDQQTAQAAAKPTRKDVPEPPPFKAVPLSETGGVPLPPETHKRTVAPHPVAQFVLPQEVTRLRSLSEVAPALPPPREMSPESFHTVSTGMSRADLLRLGQPASKITTFDDSHLVEVYSYRQNGQKFGTLHLTDGAVSSID